MEVPNNHALLLSAITESFLESSDFNGVPVASLRTRFDLTHSEAIGIIESLVADGRAAILFSDSDTNPHVQRFGFEPIDVQIRKLRVSDSATVMCVYPTSSHLESVVDNSEFTDRPYTCKLRLGEPHLAPKYFDLQVLEVYRADPRYVYSTNDVGGWISVRDEYFESEGMPARDQISLQTFGFAYDSNLARGVVVYLRYLADLSPEHQQTWRTREILGDYIPHPDYYRTSILGDWPERESIFVAYLVELYIVNEMARCIERPPLFRRDYGPYAEQRPKRFAFLVRPTLEEYHAFVLLLDKLLSENINREFFRDEVPMESEQQRPDGKLVVSQRGTLALLDDWMRISLRVDDWTDWETAIEAMRDVRRQRQRPAHAVDENRFDQVYFAEQRELMIRAYQAVRTIRLLLANYPATKEVEVPEWLFRGEIWTY